MNQVEQVNKSVISPEVNDFIDAVEFEIMAKIESGEFVAVDLPLIHTFTDGLYARQITMYPGNRITSKIHLTDHQFIISKGCVSVFNNGEETLLCAPFHGVTKAGTRRILLVHEETVWTTFHPNPNNETVEQIEDRILEKHENKLLNNNPCHS